MANLRTDYKDFIPVEGERIFNIKRENGTIVETNIVLEDVTVYENGGGDTFGAVDMNSVGVAVNEISAKVGSFKFNHDFNPAGVGEFDGYHYYRFSDPRVKAKHVAAIVPLYSGNPTNKVAQRDNTIALIDAVETFDDGTVMLYFYDGIPTASVTLQMVMLVVD